MPSIRSLDWLFIIAALAFNLLIASIFVAQKQGHETWVAWLGNAWFLTSIPLVLVFFNYISVKKPAWTLGCFGLVFIYMLAEFLLDRVFHYDFRAQWITHAPYIVLEYAALFSLIAIAIYIDRRLGWLVGGSFWVLMGSLIYFYVG